MRKPCGPAVGSIPSIIGRRRCGFIPSIAATLGEFRSASTIATLRPFSANAAATFTASILLPTPPRALARAIVAPTPERLARIRSRTSVISAEPPLPMSEKILINCLPKSLPQRSERPLKPADSAQVIPPRMTGLSDAVNNGGRALGALVVGVGRTYLAIGVGLVVESTLRFRFALLVLLTVPAQPRERHRFEAFLADLQST